MSVINVWKHKRRICNLILGLKGLIKEKQGPPVFKENENDSPSRDHFVGPICKDKFKV